MPVVFSIRTFSISVALFNALDYAVHVYCMVRGDMFNTNAFVHALTFSVPRLENHTVAQHSVGIGVKSREQHKNLIIISNKSKLEI